MEFSTPNDLEQAISMNGVVEVEGHNIRIDVAEGKRSDRGGGFDRGRGGGRGGGFRGPRPGGGDHRYEDFDRRGGGGGRGSFNGNSIFFQLFNLTIVTIDRQGRQQRQLR